MHINSSSSQCLQIIIHAHLENFLYCYFYINYNVTLFSTVCIVFATMLAEQSHLWDELFRNKHEYQKGLLRSHTKGRLLES